METARAAQGQTAPQVWRSSLHRPFPLTVQFQSLYDGVLDLLRGRPRGEKLVDTAPGHLELLHLVGLFLLHNGEDHVGIQLEVFLSKFVKTVRFPLASIHHAAHKILPASTSRSPGGNAIKTLQTPKKGLAAVLLAPPARLELTTFRLGVALTRCSSVTVNC